MLFFLRIERVARDAAFSHFLLMFGYKLFSFFFPLFLLQKGFSLPEVGYTYLFIYLPMAFFAPVAGVLNHRVNPAVLAAIGIAGYGAYSLFMMYTQNVAVFFLAQILLGISAALFFSSMRGVLMGSALENPERAFGWFYSAAFYVEAIAPFLGALLIWQFGFFGVFAMSLVIHGFNMVFTFIRMHHVTEKLKDHQGIQEIVFAFKKVMKNFFQKALFPFFVASFAVLLVGGMYSAFFALFLKELRWADSGILLYGSVFSLLFVPVSLYAIRRAATQSSLASIRQGGGIYAVSSMLFGLFAPWLHFGGILIAMLSHLYGGLLANTGRSGLLTRKFTTYPVEAGALDTVFAPLGTALGSFVAGLLIGLVGYPMLFFGGGVLVAIAVGFSFIAKTKQFSQN